MPDPDDDRLADLIGAVGRAIGWMQVALDGEVRAGRAARSFAAAELERMTEVLCLLERLRGQRPVEVQVQLLRSCRHDPRRAR